MTSCKDQKFQSMIIVRSDEMALLAGEFSRLPGSVFLMYYLLLVSFGNNYSIVCVRIQGPYLSL